MSHDSESQPVATSTLIGIPDQILLIGLMVLGAVLTETSIPDLIRLPLTLTTFVADTPDTWIPLLVVVTLIAITLGSEVRGHTGQPGQVIWLAAGTVAIAGVLWYFRAGDLDWHASPDWVKEWAYYQALHESLSGGHLPWFLTEPFQGTDRFFSNPETNVAPHVILLAWMNVSTFVVLQCVAFVAGGVLASYRLARDLRLGPVASMTFLMILLMNGHVISHLHTGHGQWVGYFAFPWMFLCLHRAATGDMSSRTQAGLSLGLALIELVGGWHLFIWCVIFVAVFVAMDRSRWRVGASVGLLVAGLSALRMVPALVFFDGHDGSFVGSYQRLSLLVGALVGEARSVRDQMDWWEYDAFVGWVGFVIIAAGLTVPLSRTWRHSVTTLWAPSVAMLVLSTFNVYRWTLFQLPGFESERVASRLLILGLLGFALMGCVQLNTWLARQPLSRTRLAALGAAGLLLAVQLVVHTNGRRPRPDRDIGPPRVGLVREQPPEMAYAASVGSGAVVTLISLGIAIQMWRRPQSLVGR